MRKITLFFLFFSVYIFGFAQINNLEIKTIVFQNDEHGNIQFFTNDPRYQTTIVSDDYPIENTNANKYEMEVVTIEGSLNVGYGMMFGAQDAYNWYAVLISPYGNFQVLQCFQWSINVIASGSSKRIINGLERKNTIRVRKVNNAYRVYLNDSLFPIHTIKNIKFEGNKIGYCVSLGGASFSMWPEGYVDIRYKIIE